MRRVGLEMTGINACENSVDKFLSWCMMVVLEKVEVKVSHNITLFVVLRNTRKNVVKFV